MPRTVIITANVRQRLKRYIYNITINPSIEPKYKVHTLRRAIDKANFILNDLYRTLSNEFVLYKPTQFNMLGKCYGYRQYQYKDKSSRTVWLFGCDTTPSFNFVMIMQNSKLCLSHVEHQGVLIIENNQFKNIFSLYRTIYNKKQNLIMKKNRIRLSESQLHRVIKESVKNVLSELDWKTYINAAGKSAARGYLAYSKAKENGVSDLDAFHETIPANARANRFGEAAKNAFNRDYRYASGTRSDGDYANVSLVGDIKYTGYHPYAIRPHVAAFKNDSCIKGEEFPQRSTARTPEEFFNEYPNSEDAINAYNAAQDEWDSYFDDNYAYDPIPEKGGTGRGWYKRNRNK